MTIHLKSIGNWFFRASVSRKIVMICGFSGALTLGTLSTLMVVRDMQFFSSRKIDQLSLLASIASGNAEAVLTFDDPITAKADLSELGREPDLIHAALFNEGGDLFAAFNREGSAALDQLPAHSGAVIRGNKIEFVQPLHLGEELVGTLVLVADGSQLRESFLQSLGLSFAIFCGGMAITVFLALGLRRVVATPLSDLATLAHQVSADQNYSRRAIKQYEDDIGSLVESFNFMLESIRQRDEALRASHRDLEGKVAARTGELKVAMEQAQAASRAKSEFLATMSHELRTPMNAIVGTASLLREADHEDERRTYIDIIRASSETLLSILNDVLDYSKIESGRLELEDRPFSLLSCAEGALGLIAGQSASKNLEVALSIDPRLPAWIRGDVTRLRQVLVNLLSNAIKFTEKGHIWLKIRQSQGADGSDLLELAVEDTGIGIPADRRHRLFQAFTQVDSSTTRRFGGTGLGLVICQRIAVAMGGTVDVESQIGKGSTFRLTIPLIPHEGSTSIVAPPPWRRDMNPRIGLEGMGVALRESMAATIQSWGGTIVDPLDSGVDAIIVHLPAGAEVPGRLRLEGETVKYIWIAQPADVGRLRKEDESIVVPSPIRIGDLRFALSEALGQAHLETASVVVEIRNDELLIDGRKPRILLAEDNLVNQRVFSMMLKRMDLAATVVASGEAAIEAVKCGQFDLVFMDYQMPVMDGIEATCRIRSEETRILQPIIIGFTANVQASAILEMKHAGMDSYLSKPVKFGDLRDTIARSLASLKPGKRKSDFSAN